MESVSQIFGLLFFLTFILAIASIIRPKIAFFLKKPTRPKAYLSWLGLSVVCLLITRATLPQPALDAATEQPAVVGQAVSQAPGDTTPPAAETVTISPTELRAQVAQLLAEFDAFKDTPTFKQCIYDCGDENPAKAWNGRRAALQELVTTQLDAPALLKLAPADLWAMGMAYAKGKMDEYDELRAVIEVGLAD